MHHCSAYVFGAGVVFETSLVEERAQHWTQSAYYGGVNDFQARIHAKSFAQFLMYTSTNEARTLVSSMNEKQKQTSG